MEEFVQALLKCFWCFQERWKVLAWMEATASAQHSGLKSVWPLPFLLQSCSLRALEVILGLSVSQKSRKHLGSGCQRVVSEQP